jgi:uncharacterized protein YoxC
MTAFVMAMALLPYVIAVVALVLVVVWGVRVLRALEARTATPDRDARAQLGRLEGRLDGLTRQLERLQERHNALEQRMESSPGGGGGMGGPSHTGGTAEGGTGPS